MSSAADLGGVRGFGAIGQEENEPVFHADWEARAMGIVIALGACGLWNLDMSRSARETLPKPFYLTANYYQIWLEAAIKLMKERGMVSDAEIDAAKAMEPPIAVKRMLAACDVQAVLFAGGPADRKPEGRPQFEIGQSVRTISDLPQTHTRLPSYARNKQGIITKIHGFHVLPDMNSQGLGEHPHWLYQVTFSSHALWGAQGNEIDTITLDLWEPYMSISDD
jgi:nitrile hydratase